MTATYKRVGCNYLPVILHKDGRREVIPGPVLGMRRTALKYAQIEINERNQRRITCTH